MVDELERAIRQRDLGLLAEPRSRGVQPRKPGLLDLPGGVTERLALLNQFLNPVEAIGQSMQAGERMMQPNMGGYDRLAAFGDMLSGVAGVAGPAVAAGRAGIPAATAIIDGLLGGSPTTQAAGDMARRFGADESGALRLGADLPAPRSDAEAMARDILQLRAEGRAADVTDDMMAAADPQYMYSNTPLPMDYASRLARAEGRGLIDDQYHATDADFEAFMPSQTGLAGRGVYSGDFASDVTDYARSGNPTGEGINIIPIRTPSANTYASKINWQNTVDADPAFPWNATIDETVEGFKRAAEAMGQRGFSGVRSQPGERVTFDPANVRSRFARFDPAFAHLRNLSAAIAAGVPIGLLSMQPNEEQY